MVGFFHLPPAQWMKLKFYSYAMWIAANEIRWITWNAKRHCSLISNNAFSNVNHCVAFFRGRRVSFSLALFCVARCVSHDFKYSDRETPLRIVFQRPQLTYFHFMWKIYGILSLFINFRLYDRCCAEWFRSFYRGLILFLVEFGCSGRWR